MRYGTFRTSSVEIICSEDGLTWRPYKVADDDHAEVIALSLNDRDDRIDAELRKFQTPDGVEDL